MNSKDKIILILAVVFTIVAPFLFTRDFGWESFEDTGQIGDTIGGITAPIIGILSIYLLYRTLKEQNEFNQKQSIIAHNEQFKSTFFLLLQEQRDIMYKLQGKFDYLKSTDVGQVENKQVSGHQFFDYARKQLNLIFFSLKSSSYYGEYDDDHALATEQEIRSDFEKESALFAPGAPKEELDSFLKCVDDKREIIRCSYINTKYHISESVYSQYQLHKTEQKIKLGYALFYEQYENVGYYFRHLYQILKFINKSENEEVSMLKSSVKGKKTETEIRDKYKQYAQFIQAQMTINELYLLFYDSFLYPKMQELIIYYEILENLTIDNLADLSHNCIEGLRMKKKKDLFEGLIVGEN